MYTKGDSTMTGNFLAKATNLFFSITFLVVSQSTVAALEIPAALETLTGEDGSVWEVVNQPGFGDKDNIAIVALCPFQENLFALTRNDETGFELWQTSDSGWTEVTVEGFTGNADFVNLYASADGERLCGDES